MPFSVDCPACGEPLDVDEDYRHWKVRCPHCRHEFFPDGRRTGPVEDEEEPPRRRRRRREYDDDDDDRPESYARRDVSGPALALKVLGWLGLVLSILGVLIWIFILVVIVNDPQAQKNMGAPRDDLINQAALYIPQGISGAILSVLVLIGAGKMARLESRGWATTAAVAGMIPFFSPCCCLGLPFGIWALTVLNRPHVRAAFRRTARRDRYDEGDDYDD
jgi:hypothetical protein